MPLKAQIVIPIHATDRPYLRAIDSVLRTPNVGVILVAHGLSKSDLSVPEDQRVVVVEVGDGVGFPGVAFNAGVRAATAPWVGIMGSDDWYEDGALQKMLSHLREDGADGIISPLRRDYNLQAEILPLNTRTRRLRPCADGLFFRTAPLGLFRREVLQSARYSFDETTRSGEDLLTSARLWTDGLSISHYGSDPAYVGGSDAKSRVTHTPGPLAERLQAWRTIWGGGRLASLSPRERESLADKMFQVGIVPLLEARPHADQWSSDDAQFLTDLVRAMRGAAPRFDDGFARTWSRVASALEAGDLERALLERQRGSFLDNRLSSSPRSLLHRNSWFLKQARQKKAHVLGGRGVRQAKSGLRSLLPLMPTRVLRALAPGVDPWRPGDEREVVRFPEEGKQRLLVGGTNTAGQAKRWADAASLLPDTSSTSLGFTGRSGRGFPADVRPPIGAAWHSLTWSKRQWEQVSKNATHVLVESGQPLLGTLFARDPRRELIAMQQSGIRVGAVLHGSDIRVPSIHRALNPDSPFTQPLDGLTETLEDSAVALNRFLDASAIPEFVSTPDLLDYRPGATWLPTLHDSELWDQGRLDREVGERGLAGTAERPVVVHIPSRAALKGTQHIGSALRELDSEGAIEYRELSGLAPEEVALQVAASDIVVDQLTMGLYGVASVEAMSLGKPVVAQVGDRVRGRIQEMSGVDLPIVEATPATLQEVVRSLAFDGGARERLGVEGRRYVEEVHSPERVANILYESFLSEEGLLGSATGN